MASTTMRRRMRSGPQLPTKRVYAIMIVEYRAKDKFGLLVPQPISALVLAL